MNEDSVTEGTVVQTQGSVHQILASFDLTYVNMYVMTYILGGSSYAWKSLVSFSGRRLDGEGKNTTKNPNKPATF